MLAGRHLMPEDEEAEAECNKSMANMMGAVILC